MLAPRKLTPWRITHWTRRWNEARDAPSVRIDIPAGSFYTAGAIAILAASIHDRQKRGLATTLRFESPEGLRQYLQRINFYSTLGVTTREDFKRHDTTGRLVEISPIRTIADADTLAQRLLELVQAQVCDFSNSLSNKTRMVLGELGANIVQHSHASDGGFGLGQGYRDAKRMEYSYADNGVGFFASMTSNPELARSIETDADAIRLAMQQGVSRNPDQRQNMGWGLSELQDLCKRSNGHLWIMSGDALLHQQYENFTLAQDSIVACPHFRGSWICLSLPVP